MTWQIEHTDTFGTDANYAWVRRLKVCIPTLKNGHERTRAQERRWLVRHAKEYARMSGARADVSDYGDMIEIRPRGMAQVVFVTWCEGESEEENAV